jgi:hypothetical protein
MKNGDQKPESDERPRNASASFPGILSLDNSHKSHRDDDQRPEMRNGFSDIDDVEIVEKKSDADSKQNQSGYKRSPISG